MTEAETRQPFALINGQNLALIAQIDRPDFDGDHLLDPTTNHALCRIHAANEAIVSYPQGAFPRDFARDAVNSTNALLEKCRGRYGVAIVKPMEQAFHRWFALWFYAGPPQHPPEIFRKRIFQQEQDLFDAICTANVKLATVTAKKRGGKDWRKDDPAVLKRRDDTKRVLAEIRKRHKATSASYPKIIDTMRRDSVWGARMRHMSAASWRAKAISR